MRATDPLLHVEHLTVDFHTRHGTVHALEHVGLRIDPGETVALVGESGSGKSVLSLATLGLLDRSGHVRSGRALFGGVDLLTLGERRLADLRGRSISMIFQNPQNALNPIRPIGKQIGDVIHRHTQLGRRAVKERVLQALTSVKIPDPLARVSAYPFELSGGMCQRVMIAMALACEPQLLIADEPTTGLDTMTAEAVLDLWHELSQRTGMATLFITHDLRLAAAHCDRIVVMHAGHVVEEAPTRELFDRPRHPYTARLIGASPGAGKTLAEITPIPGDLPDLRTALSPCRYQARCERALDACSEALVQSELSPGHHVACRNPL